MQENSRYAKSLAAELSEKDVRVELDESDEKLGYKIRAARMEKVPYIIVVGENEMKNHSMSVRSRDAEEGKQDLGEMGVASFVNLVSEG